MAAFRRTPSCVWRSTSPSIIASTGRPSAEVTSTCGVAGISRERGHWRSAMPTRTWPESRRCQPLARSSRCANSSKTSLAASSTEAFLLLPSATTWCCSIATAAGAESSSCHTSSGERRLVVDSSPHGFPSYPLRFGLDAGRSPVVPAGRHTARLRASASLRYSPPRTRPAPRRDQEGGGRRGDPRRRTRRSGGNRALPGRGELRNRKSGAPRRQEKSAGLRVRRQHPARAHRSREEANEASRHLSRDAAARALLSRARRARAGSTAAGLDAMSGRRRPTLVSLPRQASPQNGLRAFGGGPAGLVRPFERRAGQTRREKERAILALPLDDARSAAELSGDAGRRRILRNRRRLGGRRAGHLPRPERSRSGWAAHVPPDTGDDRALRQAARCAVPVEQVRADRGVRLHLRVLVPRVR